jgi:cell division protein ZapA (FtsZ GTPase activity inhibitor)
MRDHFEDSYRVFLASQRARRIQALADRVDVEMRAQELDRVAASILPTWRQQESEGT